MTDDIAELRQMAYEERKRAESSSNDCLCHLTIEGLADDVLAMLDRLEQAEYERDTLRQQLAAAEAREAWNRQLLIDAWNNGDHAGYCPSDSGQEPCICWRQAVDTYMSTQPPEPTELYKLHKQLAAATEALALYANEENWAEASDFSDGPNWWVAGYGDNGLSHDGAAVARAALAASQEPQPSSQETQSSSQETQS